MISQLFVVGGDASAVAARAQILGGIKTESCGLAQRSGFLSFPRRAEGLRRIFHNGDVICFGKLAETVHVGALSIQVDRHHARALWPRARFSAFSTFAGSRFSVAGSMSANTGVAPQRTIELTEAKKLNGVVTTLLPASTPQACNASHNASVPEAQPTLARTPRYSADSRSKPSTSGPPMKCCVRQYPLDRGVDLVLDALRTAA